MSDRSAVVAIVPAWNEEATIADTVASLRQLPEVASVLVVDDGSTDATSYRAREAGADVLMLPRNGGKARAVEEGIRRADAPLLLLIDADLGLTASLASCLVGPVVGGTADMTIARFPVVPGRGGGMGWAVRVARKGTQLLTGRELFAPLSGQRCLTREAALSALPLASGFGLEVCLNIAVLRAGFRVEEVQTAMDHRVTQNDWRGRRHRLRQLVHILRGLVHAGWVYRKRP